MLKLMYFCNFTSCSNQGNKFKKKIKMKEFNEISAQKLIFVLVHTFTRSVYKGEIFSQN